MSGANELNAKHDDLTQRIDAAKRRLADDSRMEWAEIGNLLEGLSRDMEQHADETDASKRARAYAHVEGKLADIDAQIADSTPRT